MTEYGDLILKIFHKNNYTYSSQMTLDSLIQMVSSDSDQESRRVLQKVRIFFFFNKDFTIWSCFVVFGFLLAIINNILNI